MMLLLFLKGFPSGYRSSGWDAVWGWGFLCSEELKYSFPLPSCPTHGAHYHLKGLETPSVPRILIYLTLRFPNSLVHPAQSPEVFGVSPQGPLCLERSVTTGTDRPMQLSSD